ncbi:hypothetical protein Vretifemale_458, partial [Volvox reticuliferus]
PSVPWWRSADPGASSMLGYKGCKGLDFASPSTCSSSSSSSPRQSATALNLTVYSLRTGLSEAYDAVSRIRLNQPPIIIHSAADGTSQFGNEVKQQPQQRQQQDRKHFKHYQTHVQTGMACGSPFTAAGAYKLAHAGSSGSLSSSISRKTASELLVETA